MSMFGKGTPKPLKPRQTIEVSGEHIKLRFVLVILLLAIGITAGGFAIKALLTRDSGWTVIPADSSVPAQASSDLAFEYCLSEENANAEYKLLASLYTEAVARAYQVYHPTEAFSGVKNLKTLNAAPNRELAVEPELYRAFELLQSQGSRALFLAPVYAQYDAVFRSLSDEEAALYDPAYSQEAAAFVAEVMGYVSDPEAISLELLGENRVQLKVRADYLQYASENGIDAFLDFYWLKNAFVLDDIAAKLEESGFRRGYLLSREGFCRYLDSADDFTLELLNWTPEGVYRPARLGIRGDLRVVSLRGYSLSDGAADYFYRYADGTVTTPYLDSATGASRAAIPDLTLLSRSASCAELALSALPALTAERWDASAVTALREAGIAAVWCEGKTVCHTELPAELTLTDGTYSEQTLR